jgi:hypothetical protein
MLLGYTVRWLFVVVAAKLAFLMYLNYYEISVELGV